LNALRPGGKDLTDVLRKLFQEATQKSGNDTSYALIMSCLAALPAPIPPSHLASICGLQVSEIEDFVQDTQPSLRLEDEGISIADEDVEDFIRTEGTQELQQARQRTCDYFRPIHTSDTYAAVNYADLLAAAGRATEILPIIEKNLSPAAIADPIIRREVQLRRLRLAHAACRAAGNSAATMQVVLLGAEAAKDEAFLAEILDKHPDLSIRFARSSLVRLVLSDADNAKKQARVLVQDAVRAARAGNKIQARDQLHYYDEWLSRRRKAPKDERDGWRIEIDDIVANVEAVALLDGLEEAYLELTRWKSRQLHLSVALRLVPRLIAQGNANIVEKAIRDCLLPSAWEVLFFVPLALSGMKIEVSRLEKSLMALRRALVPALKGIRHADFSDRWDPQLRELLITACEIGFSLGVSEAAVRKALNLVVDLDGPFEKHYSSFEPDILDILARAWLLRRLLDNRSHTADEFLDFIDPPPPPKEEVTPKEKASKASERNSPRGDRLEDEQKRMVRTVLPVYASRIPFLDHHRKSGKIGQDQINGLGGFGSDDYLLRRYDGIGIRARTAASVLNLMHLNGGSWEALFAKASGLASPGYSDPFGRHLLPLWRFLLLRLDSRDFVLRSLVERTPALRTVREPATDKVDAAVEFSRLALIFSEPDARTFFEDAISLAQEIDREAMNQIGVLEALSTHFASWHEHARKTAAPALANVLTDIAQRLRNQEYFPWSKCINSLVRLHPPTALAALSRWSDQGIQDHAGSMPIVERYGYYLEWNAVLCVVGEVMHKYPLWKPEDNWGTFAYWFSKMLLSKPPIWLADLRDPKPLEDPFWISGTQDDNRWVDRVSRQDFFAALFTDSGADRSVVNVDGFWSSAFPTREVRTTISSALVNPQTASALARSLSTREHKWPYHLPNADQDDRYDAQFHDMPYELSGWLIDAHNDEGIDIKDTLRNGIKGPAKSPADSVLSKLGLQANPLPEKTWKRASSDKVVLKEVVWSDLPERFDHNGSSYRQRETKSEGSLLQIDADVLMSYLKMEQMDLIVGIHFERRLEKAYGGSYDESTKIKGFEEFFIFRADGTIEDYQGIVGTWRRAH
jgi:hypothetical protein